MANLTRRAFATILAALVPATAVSAAIPSLPRRSRAIKAAQMWGGNWLMVYEAEADAFERWCPEGVEEAREQMTRKFLRPDAYDKQRRPFEVMELHRTARGELSYGDFKIRAFKTEAEALAYFEEAQAPDDGYHPSREGWKTKYGKYPNWERYGNHG